MTGATATLDTTQLLALAAALGWASGLRLYAVVFLTGLAGFLGWVDLPAGLRVLQSPLVLGASGSMLVLEFFADKIPGLDTLWDIGHTVVRIPAGAALAAAALEVIPPRGPPLSPCSVARWPPLPTPPRPRRERR